MSSKVLSLQKICLLGALLSFGIALSVSAVEQPDTDHQKVTIWSQGVRLAGDIYKPKGLATDAKLPGILMVPGWGGNKGNVGRNYAKHFASAGFVVLAFDFKSWGESDGPVVMTTALRQIDESAEVNVVGTHIRQFINPLSMMEDVRAALYYLGGEPQVMADNLGIWGTSMGGGLAVVMATQDSRIKALVDQMGPVNYHYNLKDIPANYVRTIETQMARGELLPFPGPTGNASPQLKGYPDWVAMKRFNPMSYAEQLAVPTLIIDAQEEALFDTTKNGQLLYNAIKNRVDARYSVYPVKHYDMYKGENLAKARSEGLQWFIDHLKK
ncbi:MAG: dienelactone hydrolase [Pseudomonadales bacterium]|jgi:dienelactone hydrolase